VEEEAREKGKKKKIQFAEFDDYLPLLNPSFFKKRFSRRRRMEERRRKSFFLYGWIDGWVSIDSRKERKKKRFGDQPNLFFFKKKIQKMTKFTTK